MEGKGKVIIKVAKAIFVDVTYDPYQEAYGARHRAQGAPLHPLSWPFVDAQFLTKAIPASFTRRLCLLSFQD
jgi:hypothetical protein